MGYKFNPTTGGLDVVSDPGGSDTQIQFNDAGSFGGDVDLTWNKTTNVMTVAGDVNLSDGGSFTTTLQTITPTANRTVSIPDATGTLALVAGSSGQPVYNNAGAYAGLSTATIGTTGNITLSLNGAAGVSPVALTGTWFAGTTPQVLIQPSTATAGAWSASGTGLGINAASGFSGNLLDLQVNGSSLTRVSPGGGATLTLSPASAGGSLNFTDSNFFIRRQAGGNNLEIQVQNNNVIFYSAIQIVDRDIVLSATTGTKIGTATTQKLGFFNKTPVAQPAAVADATDAATAITQLNALLSRMRDLGLIAT